MATQLSFLNDLGYQLYINGRAAYPIHQSFQGGIFYIWDRGSRLKEFAGETPQQCVHYYQKSHPQFQCELVSPFAD